MLKADGRHYFSARGLYQSLAPTAEQVFPDARNHALVPPGLRSTRVYSADLSYDYRSSSLRAKASVYYTRFRGHIHIDRHYLQDFSAVGQGDFKQGGDDFATVVMPDVDTRHIGVEGALEGQLTAGFFASAAFSVGQYTYTNLPELYWIRNATKGFEKLGKAYLENYKLSGTPQQAYTLGFSYESSRHERLGIFGDYLAGRYVKLAAVLRTRAFITDPHTRLPYRALRASALRAVLRQKRLPDVFMLDFSAGKTW